MWSRCDVESRHQQDVCVMALLYIKAAKAINSDMTSDLEASVCSCAGRCESGALVGSAI